MKTAISIPDDLFEAAERTAERLGLTRSELYRRALRQYLAEHDDQAVTERLNELYNEQPEASRLDPELERLQLASLEREEW